MIKINIIDEYFGPILSENCFLLVQPLDELFSVWL